MKQSQSLKQALGLVLITLWVLCLGYHPIRELHYTFLDAFKTALFDWQCGMAWWARILLALPLLSLTMMTVLYILKMQKNPSIRPWAVRLAIRGAVWLHLTYHSFIFWGQDFISVYVTYHLDIEHETIIRTIQWIFGENFFYTHWYNVTAILGFYTFASLYKELSQTHPESDVTSFPLSMPPAPLAERPVTMPLF